MTEILGLGLTHYPLLAVTDEHMADLLRWTLRDPGIPAAEKDPANWPALMRREWADDGGTAAAAAHREELRGHLARCRAALDAFQPDVLVVWGDDQYENFREEVVPPFCVLAYGDTEVDPFAVMNERGAPNAWGLPDDMTFTLHGDAHSARQLADDLLDDGFDVAYSYSKRRGSHFPHAIANTQLFLDYDHAGRKFPYKILPITVNCYGQHAIARRGGLARFADIHDERLDPAGPSPARCFALGAAVARAMSKTGKRVALAASSSWSHAFLNDKDWHLRPDTAADQRLYDAFVRGDYGAWTAVTGQEIVAAGQHEMLNWFCLAGAMHELGMRLTWSALVVTDVFNSNKCFAIFDGKGRPVTATISSEATGRTIDAAGISTHYHEAGSGPPVLLLHGSGPGVSAWANWRLTIPALARNYRVVAPDLVGFGCTERPRDVYYSLQTWIDHVWSFLDALGIQQTSLVGNSLGGRIGLGMAAQRPDRLHRMVLMGAPGVGMTFTDGLRALREYEPSEENMRQLLLRYFAVDPAIITDDLVRTRYEASVAPGAFEAYRDMFSSPRHAGSELGITEEQVKSVPTRTLLVHGREDQVVPVQVAWNMVRLLPDADLAVFARCGHWTQIERADDFNDLVRNFLAPAGRARN